MTERAAWLLAAAGWLLLTWGLAEAVAWWCWPLGIGAGCLAVFALWSGLRPLLQLLLGGAFTVAQEGADVVSRGQEAR